MTYTMLLNLEKITEWKLGKNTCFVMGVFADLESWAIKYKSNDGEDDNFYYLLYRSKILADLPFLGSVSSVSRAIQELEDKGIIKSINKLSNPAYCLTEKGMEWKRKSTGSTPNIPASKKNTTKTKSKFSLGKKTRFDDTEDSYKNLVKEACLIYCIENKISTDEFENFIDWHVSKGNVFVNWLSAFRNWCKKAKQIKSNDGESTLGKLEL